MMKNLLTLFLTIVCLTASAQVPNPIPWNPDADMDGWISTSDLLELLTVYGGQFSPDSWETDSMSAAVVLEGNHSYFKCQDHCNEIEGRWRMANFDAFGRHFDLASSVDAQFWVNSNNSLESGAAYPVYSMFGPTGDLTVEDISTLSSAKRCLCYIQASPMVDDVYSLLLDECGVLNGPGAIYECGCEELAPGDCDCEGNQLDAVGACGGDCLEDSNGDGVCDLYPLGPCEDETAVTYWGHQYALVEIGDQCWFAENLRTSQFRNGQSMGGSNFNINSYLTSPVGYYSQYGSQSIEVVGFWYNWCAANIHLTQPDNSLCPEGWRVPYVSDFESLKIGLGEVPGGKLKSLDNWNAPNWMATNESGFNAGGAGSRSGLAAHTSTSSNGDQTWYFAQSSASSEWPPNQVLATLRFDSGDFDISSGGSPSEQGYSVRCVKE